MPSKKFLAERKIAFEKKKAEVAERKRTAVDMYLAGERVAAICRITGCSSGRIADWVRQAGYHTRGSYGTADGTDTRRRHAPDLSDVYKGRRYA